MEVLFENQFTLTKEDAREISKVSTQAYRRLSLMMVFLFCVCSFYYVLMAGFDWYIIKTSVIVLACLFIIRTRVLRTATTRFYQQQLILHNHKSIVKTMTTFEEYMEVHSSNGAKLTVRYDQITSVKKTAHFMMVFCEKIVMIPIKKSEFTKGIPEAFEAFLLEKGIKVK